MRIIVMGTGPFAVPTCQRLLEAGHEIPLVVTRPLPEPPPKKLPPRPVFDWAKSANLPLFEPASINDDAAIDRLRQESADLFFVCDYGQILSRDALSAAKLGGINLHGSILPRHRGAAPVQWALLRGDPSAGVTVIHMTPRLDAGPALAVGSTLIEPRETAEGLEPRLAALGVACTVDAVETLENWDGTSPIGEIQDASLVTKAPRFAKRDGALDFRLPAVYLERLVRACQPWPGTFAELQLANGKKIRMMLRSAFADQGSSDSGDSSASTGENATIGTVAMSCLESGEEVLSINCGQGTLLTDAIQPAGKRQMSPAEFTRGHSVDGAKFLLPDQPLERLDQIR